MDKKYAYPIKYLLICLITLCSLAANQSFAAVDEKEVEFLAPEKAFALTVEAIPDNTEAVILNFKIAPGYQLYQNHLKFRNLAGQTIAEKTLSLPAPIEKQDEILGQIKIYKKNLQFKVPLSLVENQKSGSKGIKIQYQGCAEAGFCYPPISKQIILDPEGKILVSDLSPEEFNVGATTNTLANQSLDTSNNQQNEVTTESEVDRITALFHNKSLPIILLTFLLGGLALSFTPCVLPMVPILANILVGQNKPLSRKRSFILAVLYVVSMATCYAMAGVAAGFLGSHLATTLQQPLVLISLSFVLLLFSLSQLNLIQVQVPVFISQALNKLEAKNHSQGSALGAITMGAVSALVASPCVTPPLIGALAYISQTGNSLLGGAALFVLAIGMGLPLLVAASIGSHLLPRAGSWMVYIKLLTGALLLLLAGYFLLKAVPLSTTEASHVEVSHSSFTNVHSSEELTTAIAAARKENKPVLLDVYANWCASCKQMDKEVFENETVLNKLTDVHLLRLDLSKQTKESAALQKELGIIGPPMVIFFWPDGQEAKSYRLAGKPKFSNFLALVTQFLQETKQLGKR